MTVPDYAPIGTVRRPVTTKAEEPPQVSISPSSPIEKVTGSRHLKAAFGYSLNGALRLLRETAFRDEKSFFHRYASLSEETALTIAENLWANINLKNLRENILPTRPRADLILRKGESHRVAEVALRKL